MVVKKKKKNQWSPQEHLKLVRYEIKNIEKETRKAVKKGMEGEEEIKIVSKRPLKGFESCFFTH